eukprot:TRINITY_DN1878_c0_g2_i5.p1 TRINITY_DN1878_c0_g2~~TRINITY_DN1878_c0_g2_i5.p1  ORF type:complete len:275 (-),score=48.07 TRINITY_DN1878_c0_g2_i5:572-1396(-)
MENIRAISKINNEIIEQIKQRRSVTKHSYSIHINCDFDTSRLSLDLSEQYDNRQSDWIIQSWKPTMTSSFKQVRDMFNDNLNYDCQSFSDLENLNSKMLETALKFEMSGDIEAYPYLMEFKDNFEVIQVELSNLESILCDSVSKRYIYKKDLDEVNKRIGAIMNDVNNNNNDDNSLVCKTLDNSLEENTKFVVEMFKFYPSILSMTKLDFSHKKLGDKRIKQLFILLNNCLRMQSIKLFDNDISSKGAKYISEFLTSNSSLTELNLQSMISLHF